MRVDCFLEPSLMFCVAVLDGLKQGGGKRTDFFVDHSKQRLVMAVFALAHQFVIASSYARISLHQIAHCIRAGHGSACAASADRGRAIQGKSAIWACIITHPVSLSSWRADSFPASS